MSLLAYTCLLRPPMRLAMPFVTLTGDLLFAVVYVVIQTPQHSIRCHCQCMVHKSVRKRTSCRSPKQQYMFQMHHNRVPALSSSAVESSMQKSDANSMSSLSFKSFPTS